MDSEEGGLGRLQGTYIHTCAHMHTTLHLVHSVLNGRGGGRRGQPAWREGTVMTVLFMVEQLYIHDIVYTLCNAEICMKWEGGEQGRREGGEQGRGNQ